MLIRDKEILQSNALSQNQDFTLASQQLLKILKELVAVDKVYERRADEVPLVKLNKQLFRLKSEKLISQHPLFKLLSLAAIRILHEHCIILQLRENQIIYRQAEPSFERIYVCIVGKIALRGYTSLGDIFETIGHVTCGDTLGEEGLYEVDALRKDSAFAEQDSYLFEFTKDRMIQVKQALHKDNLAIDWFTLNNYMKRQWVQKRSWRQFKEQEMLSLKLF